MEDYIRKKQAVDKYGISYTYIRNKIKSKEIRTKLDGYLINEKDLISLMQKTNAVGRPFGKTKKMEE